MPLMNSDEYTALLAVINQLSEQNEILKQEERDIEHQLKDLRQPLKDNRTPSCRQRGTSPRVCYRPSSPPVEHLLCPAGHRARSCSPVQRGEDVMARVCYRPSSPPVEHVLCPAGHRARSCSPVQRWVDVMTTCWENESCHQPQQDVCPCSTDFEDSVLSRIANLAAEEAKLIARIIETENTLACTCTKNAFNTTNESGFENPNILSEVLEGTLPDLQIADEVTEPTGPASIPQQQQEPVILVTPPNTTHMAGIVCECHGDSKCCSTVEVRLEPKDDTFSSKSPSVLEQSNLVPSQPTALASQQALAPNLPNSLNTLLESNDDAFSSKLPSTLEEPTMVISQQEELIAPTSVYQQMSLPPPRLVETPYAKICPDCCSLARHRAISERKSSIDEAVNEMSAIQQCLEEVQEVVRNHSSLKDVLYLQESLSNVEVSILSAHFSLATAPQPDAGDEETIVSYKTPDGIIDMWMDIDATKRRLSLLVTHAQECEMCKNAFDPTFGRIEEELSALAEELKRFHNQEPIRNFP